MVVSSAADVQMPISAAGALGSARGDVTRSVARMETRASAAPEVLGLREREMPARGANAALCGQAVDLEKQERDGGSQRRLGPVALGASLVPVS